MLSKKNNKFWLLLIVFLTIFAFSPSLSGGYLNWDDTIYISSNELIKEDVGLKSFVNLYEFDKNISLVMYSYLIEYNIFGFDPFISHIINIFIHILNLILIYKLTDLLTKNKSFALIAACLFAIHPLKAESVSWLIQRKDLLFTLFYLLAAISYIRFLNSGKYLQIIFVLIFSYLSFLCKVQAIVLPASLLLFETYKNKKIKPDNLLIVSVTQLFCFISIFEIPKFLVIIIIPILIIYWRNFSIDFRIIEKLNQFKQKPIIIKILKGSAFFILFYLLNHLIRYTLKNYIPNTPTEQIISLITAYLLIIAIIIHIVFILLIIKKNDNTHPSNIIDKTLNNIIIKSNKIYLIIFNNTTNLILLIYSIALIKNLLYIYIFFKPSTVSNSLRENTFLIFIGTILLIFIKFKDLISIKLRNKTIRSIILFSLPIIAITIIFARNYSILNDLSNTILDRFIMMSYSLNYYFIKFFFPFKLNAMHPYPNPDSLSTLKYIVQPIILLSALIILGIIYKKNTDKELKRNILFGILFFVINISVVLHIFPINGKVIVADRYSYIAHFGLIFSTLSLIIFFLEKSKNKIKITKVFNFIFFAILIAFSTQTFSRSKLWNNDKVFWSDIIEKSPRNDYAHFSIGLHYYQVDKIDKAIEHYNTAISMNNLNYEYFSNRAACYVRINESSLALNDFNYAISLNNHDISSYNNRGILHINTGNLKEARNDFKKALSLNPEFIQAKSSLENVVRLLEIEETFNIDSIPNQELSEYYGNIGIQYAMKQNYLLAIDFFNKAVIYNNVDLNALVNRGNCYAAMKNYPESIKDFEKAILLNPEDGGAFLNLANILHETGNKDKACKYWEKALSLGVPNAEIMLNKFCNNLQ